MAEDQLTAFLEAVEADAVLQEKINGVTGVDALLAIAKEAGYVFTAEDVSVLKAEKELTDDEVADVSGGSHQYNPWSSANRNSSIRILMGRI